ncbi:HAD family hydrolase [Dyella caseinilytica]|uniref:HAD family hydrolase n=1 Tax=Dyella caseinilytica TaxID=1849581 RepID=A0ABX7GTD6_9GAMM|nr:HAD family hydrolase [Dyella caseinilytica]QRN53022.1 HAD family hydrolase [Dyella caseinilytica]GGA10839.1 hydrolase [Dyella caseinilytica]
MRILAITIDLDDTLWPVMPALERADRDLDNYLRQHYPQVARTWPIPVMRELRARVAAERTDLAHDFTAQRYITMQRAFDACGIAEAPLDALWEIYASARNSVELYPDALPALERLRAQWPVASLTNGNADLERIGLHLHFAHQIAARDIGLAKPDARIFLAAAERLGVAPENILHVGDDPELDVVGAREAGLRTAWINRDGHPWPGALGAAPDLNLPDLAMLVEWLDQHHA